MRMSRQLQDVIAEIDKMIFFRSFSVNTEEADTLREVKDMIISKFCFPRGSTQDENE